MSQFTRTLNFKTNNLGKDASLLLVFTPLDDKKLWKDLVPIAWRVINFPASGHQQGGVTYKNQLCFVVPQVVDNNVVSASTWIPINLGQETKLTKTGGGYNFSEPTTSTTIGQNLVADNNSGEKVSIGVGFLVNDEPSPTLIYPDVGNTSSVKCQYTPVLRAYVTSDFQETEILRGDIETRQPIWEKDLAQLSLTTNFTLTMDGTGKYNINTQL